MGLMTSDFPAKRFGVLMVVSGPSGSGKTTLCRKLRDAGSAVFSVSCTTRAPRPGEVDGFDYIFLTEEQFLAKVSAGEFFEYAKVHGNFYGTLKSSVSQQLLEGVDVLLDIDVQGAEQVRKCDDVVIRKCHVDVFILPPTFEELQQRLSSRGTEDSDKLAVRLSNAVHEISRWRNYHYVILSGTPSDDIQRFQAIMDVERLRTSRFLPSSSDA